MMAEVFIDPQMLISGQTLKGLFFIGVTALLFFIIISAYQRRIDAMKSLLDKKNRDLKIFFDRMSHDLRGPVATILGLTNVGKNFTEKEDVLHLLDRVELTAKKSDKIIQGLIKLTAILDREVSPEIIDARTLIDEIIKEERLRTMEQDWPEVHKKIPAIAFETDKKLLSFALHEIIKNAILYQNKTTGHEVDISIKEVKRKQLIITICDTGIGISANQMKRVYDLFYRGLSSKGAGIGLYTANMAIEKLQGKLNLENRQTQGSAFTIWLPCRIHSLQ